MIFHYEKIMRFSPGKSSRIKVKVILRFLGHFNKDNFQMILRVKKLTTKQLANWPKLLHFQNLAAAWMEQTMAGLAQPEVDEAKKRKISEVSYVLRLLDWLSGRL